MRIRICNICTRIARRKRNDGSRFHLAAVFSQGSRVYAFGVNSNRPPGQYPNSVHAEVACLRNVPVVTSGDLYVARVLATGNLAMAKPCPACMEYIRSHGVDTIHYSTNNGGWESLELRHER
jgi:cytidine deaminase